MVVILEMGYVPLGFHGYARQPDKRTVEGDVVALLLERNIILDADISNIRSASRTDRGVGAIQNFITFPSELSLGQIALRLSDSPNGIIFKNLGKVNNDFNPRYAISREYVFFLPDKMVGDLGLFKNALSLFQGEHDFRSFSKKDPSKTNKNPSRKQIIYDIGFHRYRLDLDLRAMDNTGIELNSSSHFSFSKEIFELNICGNYFLYQQIRRMVGSAIGVSRGEIKTQDIVDSLNDPNNRKFKPMGPEGLFLKRVLYKKELISDIIEIDDKLDGSFRPDLQSYLNKLLLIRSYNELS